jgi:hypothetical protein
VIVIQASENPVSAAITFQEVVDQESGLYSIVAVGEILSIRFIVATVSHLFPAISSNSKVNDQLSVKV